MQTVLQPRRPEAKKILLVSGTLIALFAWGMFRHREPAAEAVHLSGETMGSTFNITLVAPNLTTQKVDEVGAAVEACLAEIDRQMSTYRPDSEISAFNRQTSAAPFAVSAEFAHMMKFALDLSEKSGGVFDLTIAPLVNAWGFGSKGRRATPPTAETIGNLKAGIGWRHVAMTPDGRLVKDAPGTELDVGAIASGYGADLVGRAIAAQGITNYMVEIGGEVCTSGLNAQGAKWRIGIDHPLPDLQPGEQLHGVLHLSGLAVSTSGGYRSYVKDEQGNEYSHIFDPRLGAPVKRPRCSTTIVAPDCMTADALATVLYVMGPEEGVAWIQKAYPQAEALFVVIHPDGTSTDHTTPGFARRTGYQRKMK